MAVVGAIAGDVARSRVRQSKCNRHRDPDPADLTNVLDFADDDGRRWDLLALAETDTASALETAGAFNALYGGGYSVATSLADDGGDRTGFVYDTAALELVEFVTILGNALDHTISQGTFRVLDAAPGDANALFTAYSIHLHSGDSNADAGQRAQEARIITDSRFALPAGRNLLYMGDFNWLASDEGTGSLYAYDEFDAVAFDPVGPGTYRDNAAFLEFHTQNPGAAMDDRFDAQFVGDTFADGAGLEYVAGSYDVLGNNGTHALNAAITTGTGAPSDVLASLASFSDHLPVVADYTYVAVPEPGGVAVVTIAALATLRRRRA